MIRLLDKLFFVIYNSYYKDGGYKNDIPSLTVGGIFGIFFLSLTLSAYCIIGWVYPEYERLPHWSKSVLTLITLMFGVLTYFIFYHHKRYTKIYERYKGNEFLNGRIAKFGSFTIIIIGIIFPLILALVRNKISKGHWY